MKIILVVGARPNFMKIAPLLRAIEKHNANHQPPSTIHHLLAHTGQHYDYEMSQVFFQDLELPKPDVYLGVGSGTHAEQTGKVMIEFEKVLLKEKPDLVIVVGDVNSTLAAALAAAKLYIPVAHVEAGLRAHVRATPEEINRLLTDHISDYLFTTSKYDDKNLEKEGIPAGSIFRVGNTMVDSLLYNKPLAQKSDILPRLGLKKHDYALLTLHRPSNVDSEKPLKQILKTIQEVTKSIKVVFPAHPRTQKRLQEFNLNLPAHVIANEEWQSQSQSQSQSESESKSAISIISPLGYLDFLNLMMNSRFVITDSGGIQAETTILNIPCLTMLDSPIWTITHKQGTNILVGNDGRRINEEVPKLLTAKSPVTSHRPPPLWDGKAAERIVDILTHKHMD